MQVCLVQVELLEPVVLGHKGGQAGVRVDAPVEVDESLSVLLDEVFKLVFVVD